LTGQKKTINNQENKKKMKAIPTIHELRRSGLKVTVNHNRVFYKYDAKTGRRDTIVCTWAEQQEQYSDFYVSATGGFTRVCILDEEGNSTCGVSICSEFDHYNKKLGTKKAVARTLSQRLLDSRSA
jgi:hypothetical protein